MDNEVKADFEMPDLICPEDPVNVTNTSTGLVDTWQWTFGNIGSSGLKDPAPQYFPQSNIELYYTIKLIVSNNTFNCSDSLSKPLRVLNNCIIAVPSAFTPNNDGLNDFLYPLNAMKVTNLEFQVFNRWGQLVFSTRNGREKWNGTVKGIMQPPGVFAWYLKYTDSATGQKVFQKRNDNANKIIQNLKGYPVILQFWLLFSVFSWQLLYHCVLYRIISYHTVP